MHHRSSHDMWVPINSDLRDRQLFDLRSERCGRNILLAKSGGLWISPVCAEPLFCAWIRLGQQRARFRSPSNRRSGTVVVLALWCEAEGEVSIRGWLNVQLDLFGNVVTNMY